MRFQKINLLKYGHFSDFTLTFPDQEFDFHIIYGDNECGKSTIRNSINDLLFGIPMKSPYAFLHDYSLLRLGATIEHAGEWLTFERRKGNKETLRNTENDPLADSILIPFLGKNDRTFYIRMFSLDQDELETGGRNILEERDEIGQVLFAAGTGIANLHQRLAKLEDEANSFWGPRKSQDRVYYKAKNRVETADECFKAVSVSVQQWRTLKEEKESAQDKYDNVQKAFLDASTQLSRLNRIRRVFPDIQRKQSLDQSIDRLGPIILLASDAENILQEVLNTIHQTQSQQQTIENNLNHAQEGLSTLTPDPHLLRQASEINDCLQALGTYERYCKTLPQSERELESLENTICQCARELDWQNDSVESILLRLPLLSKIKPIQQAFERYIQLEERLNTQSDVLLKVRAKGDEHSPSEEIRDFTDLDFSALKVALTTVDKSEGLLSEFKAQEKYCHRLESDLEAELNRLSDWKGTMIELQALSVPNLGQVNVISTQLGVLQEKRARNQEEFLKMTQILERRTKDYERMLKKKKLITHAELEESRQHRQRGWELIRKKYFQQEEVPPASAQAFLSNDSDLVLTYETAVEASDQLSDERFETVADIQKLEQLSDEIESVNIQLEQIKQCELTYKTEQEVIETHWRMLWQETAINPNAPELMKDWLNHRDSALTIHHELTQARREWDRLATQLNGYKSSILEALNTVSYPVSKIEDSNLQSIRQVGRDVYDQEMKHIEARARMAQELKEAEFSVQKAESDMQIWTNHWQELMRSANLEPSPPDAGMQIRLETLEQLRNLEKARQKLKDNQIHQMRQEMTDFEQKSSSLLEKVASDLLNCPLSEAFPILQERFQEAQKIETQREAKEQQLQVYQTQSEELLMMQAQAESRLEPLKQAADASDVDSLKAAILRSNHYRALSDERDAVVIRLQSQSDGQSIETLTSECADMDFDDLAGQIQSLEQEVQERLKGSNELAQTLQTAKNKLEAITGSDAAISAITEKNLGLSDMADAIERYAFLKAQAQLLRWGIERYRKQNQTPLLKRAGAIFSQLTLGSFTGLEIDYDENEKGHLMGIRPDNRPIHVSTGMSSGSENQLYLALRLAAIENYLSKAQALPCIMDDLFIKFDNSRITAGLNILSELAQQTQVIFFTHEAEIVEMARAELKSKVNIISLPQSSRTYARTSVK